MIYFYIIFALLGAAIGSFLNVVIDRLPQKQSLAYPPSHCPACGQRLRARDLVPVISYLTLGGRCRYCKTPIPQRILWVELGTAVGFALLLVLYGLSVELVVACFYWALLTVILVISLEQKTLPSAIIYPAAAIVLILNVLDYDPGLLNGFIGVAVGALVMLPLSLGRGNAGRSDIQMAALAGLALGFPEGMVAVLIGVVAAGLALGLVWFLRQKGGTAKITVLAPFVAVSMLLMLLWGQNITGWYLGLFR